MALDVLVVSGISDAKTAVLAAGALIVGVYVAIKVYDWLRLVLIEREASKEYYDRYGR